MDIYVTVEMVMVNTGKQANTSVIVRVLGMRGRSVVDSGEILYIPQVWSLDRLYVNIMIIKKLDGKLVITHNVSKRIGVLMAPLPC